jgi:hypothetical protein
VRHGTLDRLVDMHAGVVRNVDVEITHQRDDDGVVVARDGDPQVPAAESRHSPPDALSVLVTALLGFAGVGFDASLFGFRFLARDIALRVTLLLLRPALATKLVVAGHRAGGLLHFAFHTLDDAFDAGRGTTLVMICHDAPSGFGEERFVPRLLCKR